MKFFAPLRLCAILFALPAFAAVQGTITNKTTGRPQAGVSVTVLKLEEQQGMVPVGQATTDAQGRFRVEAPPPAGMPYLVRADFRGVGYHAPARPGSGPDIEVSIDVYDTTAGKSAAKLAGHQVILQPVTGRLMVLETYTVTNSTSPPRTYSAKESFRFWLPDVEPQDLSVSATGPGQLPLRQTTEAKGKGLYSMDYAFRPGNTKLEVTYRLPYESEYVFKKGGAEGPEIQVIVPLEGVVVKGKNLAETSRDTSQGAVFYTWKGPQPLELEIAGTMPEPAAAGAGAGEGGGAGGGEEISTVERPNSITESRWPVLVVLGTALALGLAHLYRLDLLKK
jgi:hypothetical protein